MPFLASTCCLCLTAPLDALGPSCELAKEPFQRGVMGLGLSGSSALLSFVGTSVGGGCRVQTPPSGSTQPSTAQWWQMG